MGDIIVVLGFGMILLGYVLMEMRAAKSGCPGNKYGSKHWFINYRTCAYCGVRIEDVDAQDR